MAKRTRKTKVFRSIDEFKREMFPNWTKEADEKPRVAGTGLATEIFQRMREQLGKKKPSSR